MRFVACKTADWEKHAEHMLDNCWYLARYANQDYVAMTHLPCSRIRAGCKTIARYLEKEFGDDD